MDNKFDCMKEILNTLEKYEVEDFCICYGEGDEKEKFTLIASAPHNDNIAKVATYATKNQAVNKLRYKDQLSYADFLEYAQKNAGQIKLLEGGNYALHIYYGGNQINIVGKNKIAEWVILFLDKEEAKLFKCDNGYTDYDNPLSTTKDLENVSPLEYLPGYISSIIRKAIKL